MRWSIWIFNVCGDKKTRFQCQENLKIHKFANINNIKCKFFLIFLFIITTTQRMLFHHYCLCKLMLHLAKLSQNFFLSHPFKYDNIALAVLFSYYLFPPRKQNIISLFTIFPSKIYIFSQQYPLLGNLEIFKSMSKFPCL